MKRCPGLHCTVRRAVRGDFPVVSASYRWAYSWAMAMGLSRQREDVEEAGFIGERNAASLVESEVRKGCKEFVDRNPQEKLA